MKTFVTAVCVAALIGPGSAVAQKLSPSEMAAMRAADVVILGEYHDNPAQHANQAELVGTLAPRALVWEMLSEDAARAVSADLVADPERMGDVLGWAQSGWPDFSMYHPIFAAASDAAIYGALVPREMAQIGRAHV